jgi:hypothetical protein
LNFYTMDDCEKGSWEGIAAAAYLHAGIAVEQVQLASTARALRRLYPVFTGSGSSAACVESFAGTLEKLAHD